MLNKKGIIWPDYYHPKNSQIHIKNQLDISASAEEIWHCLVHAPCWPTWKHSSTSVQIINGDGIELAKNAQFYWKTKRAAFKCTVVEFTPHKQLAWKGKMGAVDMYHAWLIEPTSKGCRVITESTQRNGLTWLTKYFMSNQFRTYHRHWLEELQEQHLKQSTVGTLSNN
ncbi:SRPBCC domain-containing protein [Agarivorans sp. TSD2052]|uniref:SRPBCC domain-containing protein n=1 Tax=Agarivorans sp. TSD2052 TaxID=2937286 RepID=UPI00200EA20B|nr:SRPBCC domain-containing protein [Agarivorans sp. TSD2052]UPW17037.1 SRPBCC domain-containing protein [Agarivorans sp. TSD2052]